MIRRVRVWTWLSLIGLLSLSTSRAADDLPGSQGTGRQGAVSAGGAEAVAAGLEILKRGGNAADSAAATILALSVTDSGGFCFGGEVPILVGSSGDPGRLLKAVIRVRVPIRVRPAFLIAESETHCAHGWELTHG